MTRLEITAKWDCLTPRERDAWIAEEILGWHKSEQYKNKKFLDGWGWLDENGEMTYLNNYSTHILPAWELAQKVRKDKFFQLTQEPSFNHYWVCIIGEITEVEETAPKAICLTALIATLEV